MSRGRIDPVDPARPTNPQPKGPRAKPGKRAPTAEERRWLEFITGFGCIACWLDGKPGARPAVHHIIRGGLRMGHLWTLPLCDPGHHQNGARLGMVSRHPDRLAFERRYGTEYELLQRLQRMYEGGDPCRNS